MKHIYLLANSDLNATCALVEGLHMHINYLNDPPGCVYFWMRWNPDNRALFHTLSSRFYPAPCSLIEGCLVPDSLIWDIEHENLIIIGERDMVFDCMKGILSAAGNPVIPADLKNSFLYCISLSDERIRSSCLLMEAA